MTGGIMDPILRPLTRDHLAGALLLSRQAGWPHRAGDWSLLHQISQGFVVTGAGGEVLGTAMRTPFGPVSMANMIIVDQALRGRGMGRRLLQALLDLAPKDEWRLIATPEGFPLYQSLGFTETGTIRQYQGTLTTTDTFPDVPGAPAARWSDAPDLAQLARLDQLAQGADRHIFFQAIPDKARVAIVEDAGGLAAFGILRPFGRGWALAPLIARDSAAATAILALAAFESTGRFLRIDTISAPGVDCPLAGPLARIGLPEVGRGTAMTRPGPGKTPITPIGTYQRFALAAQALG
ncbi:GNAT family N-acetyltransferase [Paracoccus sp. IB05]|uniref:GNAT family N-acetyltransferase n=1 Tax=Paracoccus sp. IB05 TaxID=2779367 RepID=UPI0018E8DAD4|nr:GNAT family N-acetyltransferase [Paracoccus sp. IB05]MBJ2152856.1 GNAT family N-acetyltransferase [Paracoccus sp. IB05]